MFDNFLMKQVSEELERALARIGPTRVAGRYVLSTIINLVFYDFDCLYAF